MTPPKPRITITLKPEQYDVLNRLAALQRRPMSGILSEFLDEVTPSLEKLIVSLEAVTKARQDLQSALHDAANRRSRPYGNTSTSPLPNQQL